jgi:hypothetical protein
MRSAAFSPQGIMAYIKAAGRPVIYVFSNEKALPLNFIIAQQYKRWQTGEIRSCSEGIFIRIQFSATE